MDTGKTAVTPAGHASGILPEKTGTGIQDGACGSR